MVSTHGAPIGISHSPEELAVVDTGFQTAPAGKSIQWAISEFGTDLLLAASFQDIVLIDLAVRVTPGIEVVFLDTDAHFPETLEFVESIRKRFDLNLTITTPAPEAVDWPCGSARCCEFRKIDPLRTALSGKRAWMTALKRSDAATRSGAPIVGWDATFNLVKVNPMATWTDADIDAYLVDHDLPFHPLVERGYHSIGCAPTTRPTEAGEDPRSGRWSDTGKTECGLHA